MFGWCVLLAGVGAFVLAVSRRAKVHGILLPLLVGFVLRLAVMLIAHIGSVSLGDHGIFYLDDRTYFRGASLLAHLWQNGHTPDPARAQVLGTFQVGYQLFLAGIFALSTPSIILGKLVTVLLGTATILVSARLAGRILGERAKVRAAWVTALAPSMVWWAASMSKEAIATLLLVSGLLAITYLPRPRAVAMLGAIVAFLLILRGPAGLALVVGAGIAIALTGRQVERKWLSSPVKRFGAILVGGFVLITVVASHGNLHLFFHQYESVVNHMISQYQGGNPARVPYDVGKSLVTPLPWVFDRGTENWDRGLYPGVWLLICALPLAAAGAWRLRRRPELWAMLGTAGTALIINAYTSGFVFRQRSMIEPIIFILALGGARSWRFAARIASATLVVAAGGAGIQSGSPLTAAVIAAAAGALYLASLRLPSRPFESLPDSPMVASFRASHEATAAMDGRWPSALMGAAAALRSRVLRGSPRLDASRAAPAVRPQSVAALAGQAKRTLTAAAEKAPPLEPAVHRGTGRLTGPAGVRVAGAWSAVLRTAPRIEPPGSEGDPRA